MQGNAFLAGTSDFETAKRARLQAIHAEWIGEDSAGRSAGEGRHKHMSGFRNKTDLLPVH